MPVTLQHRLRSMIPYNLDHEHYCWSLGRCECTAITTRVYVRTPASGMKVVEKQAPPVLTLLARETRRGLPDAVLTAPSIVSAIKRGDIRVL
jgi:hypothetical protein